MTLEDLPDKVRLLGIGRVRGVLLLCAGELLVGDLAGRVSLEAVDPRVTDTVRELLLLAPEDRVGEVGL